MIFEGASDSNEILTRLGYILLTLRVHILLVQSQHESAMTLLLGSFPVILLNTY